MIHEDLHVHVGWGMAGREVNLFMNLFDLFTLRLDLGPNSFSNRCNTG